MVEFKIQLFADFCLLEHLPTHCRLIPCNLQLLSAGIQQRDCLEKYEYLHLFYQILAACQPIRQQYFFSHTKAALATSQPAVFMKTSILNFNDYISNWCEIGNSSPSWPYPTGLFLLSFCSSLCSSYTAIYSLVGWFFVLSEFCSLQISTMVCNFVLSEL